MPELLTADGTIIIFFTWGVIRIAQVTIREHRAAQAGRLTTHQASCILQERIKEHRAHLDVLVNRNRRGRAPGC